MSIPPWTDKAKDRAKREKRYLVKILIQGRYADDGRMAVSGDMDGENAKLLATLALSMLTDVGDERI